MRVTIGTRMRPDGRREDRGNARPHGGNSSKTWAAAHKLDMVGASPTSCLFAIEGVIE